MLQSARLMLPIVMRLMAPDSVIDVGCGRGAWLRVFQELGVRTIRGLDGHYVDPSKILVPEECFTPTDLSKPFHVPSRYDLAVCLEVGEHLPEKVAPTLVAKLVEAAPAVLFSAALPGQGGNQHINERMPAYWRALFRRHCYALLDPIRPLILTDTRIEWWYRQNVVLYASEATIRAIPELEANRLPENGHGIEWVHVNVLNNQGGLRSLSKQLAPAMGSALRKMCRMCLSK